MDIITVLPYAIAVSLIAYCLNRILNVSDKKKIKVKKLLGLVTFVLLTYCICNVAVLLEYQFSYRAIIRFTTENILTIKNHYILGKGLFITLAITSITICYNFIGAKIQAKRIAKEAERTKYEIENEVTEKPFWERLHLLDAFCYITLSTVTYLISSVVFLKFIAFVAKTYIRYNA